MLILTKEECTNHFAQLPTEVQQWMIQIVLELNEAILLHPHWPRDMIHAAGIVCEESGELIRSALMHRYEGGDATEMIREAKQTAAMALRFLINCRFEIPNLKY